MESKSRLGRLESLIQQNKGIELSRLQSLVFLAQAVGDSYGYSFDVQHLRVFSRALEADIEFLSNQVTSDRSAPSEISEVVARKIRTVSLEQAEAAAAFIYFEQKGYSSSDIESALNAEETVMNAAKSLVLELKKLGTKTLTGSGAR